MRDLTRCCLTALLTVVFARLAGAVDGEPEIVPRLDEFGVRETRREVETIPGTTVSLELVRVPGGTFDFGIGKEAPEAVQVRPFWIGRTEVTWEQFDAFAHVRNPGGPSPSLIRRASRRRTCCLVSASIGSRRSA